MSLKVFAGANYEVLQPDTKVLPTFGAELVLKPWTIAAYNGTVTMEGNVVYYWDSPGDQDKHTLRGQLIAGFKMIGPLELTLSAIGTIRKDRDTDFGKGFGVQAGVRLRFVSRAMVE